MPTTEQMVRKPKTPLCSVTEPGGDENPCGRPMVKIGEGEASVWVCPVCDVIDHVLDA